jgi:rod shape-determining protein MreD
VRDFLKHIFRFAAFILIQVYVLNKIPHLHRFIIPYLYYLPLLWLPFSVSRMWLLVIGFITGLTLDYFMMTPGLHAAACVLIAFFRPYIINVFTPKESTEFN